ncbi:2,3-bisphosphoglycerate-independent phosphoglycerate mutase, partial [bacterium]|nr:2,3-bisphosphoglycerate-independent phosphoglycerate mutase [bacterium]
MVKPVLLVILDGWGLKEAEAGNAIKQARLPNYRRLEATYPHTQLKAAGEVVGLPGGQMGNSEVGHLNIGAGRVVYQDLTRISMAIRDGSFFANEVLRGAARVAKQSGGALHLIGLLSDGGVHSHIDHVFALLELAKQSGVREVYLHVFLDGRDVPPESALAYIDALEAECDRLHVGRIATVMGRFFA